MVVAIVLIVVSLLIGMIFDRMARAARLRRDKGYDWYLTAIGSVLGAGLGWMDGGGVGAGIGAVVGFLTATLASSIIFGTLSVVWTLLRGPLPRSGYANERATSMEHRIGILVAGLLPVAFSIVIAHETFWMVNLLSLTAQNDVGSRVAAAAANDEPREKLRAIVADRRWHVAAPTWRPTKWLLQPEQLAAGQSELAFLDMIDEREPPEEKPDGWTDLLREDLLWDLWKIDGFKSQMLTNATVAEVAVSIAQRRADLYSECAERTWILRFLPKDMFIKVRGQ